MIENKKIFILGLARSGYHVAKLLAGKNEIVVCDQKMPEEKILNELKDLNVQFYQSETGEELLDNTFDLMIKNPGIDPRHLAVLKAKKLKIKVVNEMEVAYHYLPKNTKIIGITGSNGKTTTATILYNLLKLHNVSTVLGGNIGYPLSEIISKVKENDVLVLEISDHQLYDLDEFKTDISILTNLCPTHLDYHGTYENYKNTKRKIFNHHTKQDIAIINYANKDSLEVSSHIMSNPIYFNNNQNYYNDEGIFIDNELIIKNLHIIYYIYCTKLLDNYRLKIV